MELSVIVNNDGMKINVGVNVNNSLIKEHAINDLFGILVIVNVIKIVILVNIWTMKIVNTEKN